MLKISKSHISVSKSFPTSPHILWDLLTDTTQWPRWGPTVKAVRTSKRYISKASEGQVLTAFGIWLPFVVTDYEHERFWSWKVAHDESFKYIMKRLLETSMAESFNSILITEAGPGYPIVYANAAFSELTGYAPGEVMGKSPSMLQGSNTDPAVLERLNGDIAQGRLFHGQAINYRI